MAPRKTKAPVITMTWPELQTYLKTAGDEAELLKMLDAEKSGKKRPQCLLRIHGRYNVLRAKRERADLLK